MLSVLVFIGLQLVLRATPFGLQMRAVTQNRRMAASMGISTSRVDMLAFGLGSGIAGIAGVALSQIDNVSPNLGQGYIIDSFMVVVFGGVGNLWGTAFGALLIGLANKLLEPLIGAVQGQIVLLVFIILFIQRRPRGLFALRGRAVGSMSARLDQLGIVFVAILIAGAIAVPLLSLAVSPNSPLYLPPYLVQLLGKYLCYAILAVALDLVWGYCGILSLGHGAFFALGGYAMGMYLMRQIGTRGVYAQSDPAGFHGVPELEGAARRVVGIQLVSLRDADGRPGARPPGARLRLVCLPFACDRRLSLDHHPGDDVCVVQGILPQRFRLRRQQRA